MGNAVYIPLDSSCLCETWGREIVSLKDTDLLHDKLGKHTENKQIAQINFYDFVVIKLSGMPVGDIDIDALKSFTDFVVSSCHCDLFSEAVIKRWIAEMIAKKVPHNHRKRNFALLHSAFREYLGDAYVADIDPFLNLRSTVAMKIPVKERDAALSNARILDTNIQRIADAAKTRPALSTFLYMLYRGGGNFEVALYLQFEDLARAASRQEQELIDSLLTHHRQKYVFKFNQSQKRAPQLLRELRSDIEFTLRNMGMTFPAGFSSDSITALWIAKAIRAGISLPDIRGVVTRIPAEFAYLSLVEPSRLTEEQRATIMQRVADAIIDTTPSWHVMKLRKGVTPHDVETAIGTAIPQLMRTITFFYPVRKVACKDGKKMAFESVPYLPDILFFRMRSDGITPLFRHIGDLAWCYRQTNSSTSPYTSIPAKEMEIFQRAVEQFTTDIKMELSERPPLGIGRRVRITTGVMEGLETVIYDVKNAAGPNRVCCLRLSDSANIMWDIDIEEKYLEPID